MTSRMEAELIGVLGEEGYFALVSACGGQITYIPKTPKKTVLASQIGEEYSAILAAHYGGEHLDVPLSRHFRARMLFAKGQTVKAISKKLLMSERHVYKVLAELSAEDRNRGQRDLFL